LSSNSAKLLAEGGGAQSEAEKRKPKGASSDRPEREIKTSFDAQRKRLGNLYPKTPDGSAIYPVRL
jgi:hypothetical protein